MRSQNLAQSDPELELLLPQVLYVGTTGTHQHTCLRQEVGGVRSGRPGEELLSFNRVGQRSWGTSEGSLPSPLVLIFPLFQATVFLGQAFSSQRKMNILFETGILFNSKNSKGFLWKFRFSTDHTTSVLLGRVQKTTVRKTEPLFPKSFFTGSDGAHLQSQYVVDRQEEDQEFKVILVLQSKQRPACFTLDTVSNKILKKEGWWDDSVDKAIATKPVNLSSILRTHVAGEN